MLGEAVPDPTEAGGSPFQVDHQADPEWAPAPPTPSADSQLSSPAEPQPFNDPFAGGAPEMGAGPEAPTPLADALPEPFTMEPEAPTPPAAEPAPAAETVTLDQVVPDRELFDDPSLDVARMKPGEEREIVVPVEVGDPSVDMRRFKLTIKLRLDGVD